MQFIVEPKRWRRGRQTTVASKHTAINRFSLISAWVDRILCVACFVKADESFIIIRMDFLQRYNLWIDLKHGRVCDPITRRYFSGQQTTISCLGLAAEQPKFPFLRLLAECLSLTHTDDSPLPSEHNVVYHTETRGSSVFFRLWRLAPDRLRIAKEEFDQILSLGLIRSSKTSWSSALHVMPKKKSGSWHPCGYCRTLNAVTVPGHCHLPHIHDFAVGLAGITVFSNIEFLRA